MPKRANPRKQGLRAFVEQVNSDPHVRMQFLADPVHILDKAGIQLSKKAKSELQTLVHEYVEKFPDIALLPPSLPGKSSRRTESTARVGTERECIYIV